MEHHFIAVRLTEDRVQPLIRLLQDDGIEVMVYYARGGDEVSQLLMQVEKSIVLWGASNHDELMDAARFFNNSEYQTIKNRIRVLLLSVFTSPGLADKFQEMGAQDYLPVWIPDKSLHFKSKLLFRTLQNDPAKKGIGEALERFESKSKQFPNWNLKSLEGEGGVLVEIGKDLWLFRKEKTNYIYGQWEGQLDGPDPSEGRWAFDGVSASGQKLWRWQDFKNPGKSSFFRGRSDSWLYCGEQPQYNAKSKKWAFISNQAHLSFVREREKEAPDGAPPEEKQQPVSRPEPKPDKNLQKFLQEKKDARRKRKEMDLLAIEAIIAQETSASVRPPEGTAADAGAAFALGISDLLAKRAPVSDIFNLLVKTLRSLLKVDSVGIATRVLDISDQECWVVPFSTLSHTRSGESLEAALIALCNEAVQHGAPRTLFSLHGLDHIEPIRTCESGAGAEPAVLILQKVENPLPFNPKERALILDLVGDFLRVMTGISLTGGDPFTMAASTDKR